MIPLTLCARAEGLQYIVVMCVVCVCHCVSGTVTAFSARVLITTKVLCSKVMALFIVYLI